MYKKLPGTAHLSDLKCATTPDGGFLYLGVNSINFIGSVNNDNTPPELQVIYSRINLSAIDINPLWNKQGRSFSALADDGAVLIWDLDSKKVICGHKAHVSTTGQREDRRCSKSIFLSYMSNSNVMTLDDKDVVIYCTASNTFCRRTHSLQPRGQYITSLRCSPFEENIFALGTNRGLVVICDIKKMEAIYKLQGHMNSIASLAWQPISVVSEVMLAPITEAAKKSSNSTSAKMKTYNFNYLLTEFGTPNTRYMKDNSSEDAYGFEVGKPPLNIDNKLFDYNEECKNIKSELEKFQNRSTSDAINAIMEQQNKIEVTLADCLQDKIGVADYSLSDSTKGQSIKTSSEDSLELSEYDSSDDGFIVDGDQRKPKHEVLHHIHHQAEVHATSSADLDGFGCKQTIETSEPRSNTSINLTDSSELKTKTEVNTLLASISVNGTLWLWNTKTGSACLNMFRKKYEPYPNNHIVWLSESILIVTTNLGVTCLNLQKREGSYQFERNDDHKISKDIFTIKSCASTGNVWAISKERSVLRLCSKTLDIVAKYDAVTMNIQYIAECPDDLNKIALGTAEKRLGILDISKISPLNITVKYYKTNCSQILVIAWSPDCTKLTYGTADGKIGVVNIETEKHLFIFKPLFSKPIYTLKWQGNYIFFVNSHKLAMYDVNKPNADAYVFLDIERPTEINFHGHFLFVGTQDGHLMLYRCRQDATVYLVHLKTIFLLTRFVSLLVWNPILPDVIAVAGSCSEIFVLHFKAEEANIEVKHKLIINERRSVVHDLKWSNYNENIFITSTHSGMIHVWNLSKEEKLIYFKEFPCPIYCAAFLPINESLVMCSGLSLTLEFFSIFSEIKKQSNKYTNALENVRWAAKIVEGPKSIELNAAKIALPRLRKRRKGKKNYNDDSNNDNKITTIEENNENDENILKVIDELSIKATPKNQAKQANEVNQFLYTKSLFSAVKKELNKEAITKLKIVLTADKNAIEKSVQCFNLFKRNEELGPYLYLELNKHTNSFNEGFANIFFGLLNSNIEKELQKCIDNKTLTEWHVSLAASVSLEFWRKCAIAYSQQLASKGYILQAVNYLLAARQYNRAAEILLDGKYFAELVLVTSIHFPNSHQLHEDSIKKWIDYLDFTGNLAGAALLCVLNKNYQRAYQLLRKNLTKTEEINQILQLIKKKIDLKDNIIIMSDAD